MTSVSGSKFSVLQLLSLALLAVLVFGTSGCKAKPSEKDCKTAINNVRRINKQDSSDMGADPIAMIRSCRGSSSQKSVACMIAAETEDDLRACEGDLGQEYFNKEVEATEKRIKESGGNEEGKATDSPEPGAAAVAPAVVAPAVAAPEVEAPEDAVAEDAVPEDAAPTKAAPTKAAPTKAAPTKTAPTKAAPTKAAPTKTAPTKAAPTKVAPTKAPAATPPAAP